MRYIFTALFVLLSTSIFAQGRPPKEICRELGVVNPETEEFEGCQPVDSQEVIVLKELFNSLSHDLEVQLHLQNEFRSSVVTQRRNDFGAAIAKLLTVRGALREQASIDKIQAQIDKLVNRRDEVDSTEPGSERDRAANAGAVISSLNQQLNDVEAALLSVSP